MKIVLTFLHPSNLTKLHLSRNEVDFSKRLGELGAHWVNKSTGFSDEKQIHHAKIYFENEIVERKFADT